MEPHCSAKMFVEEKTRRSRDITTGKNQSKQQSWFKGVFSEADICADDDGNENDERDEGGSLFEF